MVIKIQLKPTVQVIARLHGRKLQKHVDLFHDSYLQQNHITSILRDNILNSVIVQKLKLTVSFHFHI